MITEVVADEGGKRLDAALSDCIPELSRSFIQKLIDEGAVTLDGKPLKKSYRTEEGNVFRLEIPEPENIRIEPQNIPLDVLYEDNDIIVVNKPRGMVVHPAPGHPDGTLVNALMYHCGDSLSGINGIIRPGIVHRLDMDTSGLLIAAKNDSAHRALAEQLKDHSMARVYEAVVHGGMREDSGTVDAPIGRHPADRMKQCVTDRNSKEAVTHWEVVRRYRSWTHIRCRLETGRTHQIRVHMAYIGHPVLGDAVYGKSPEMGLSGQCLHAGELTFVHPTSGLRMTLRCPLPEYFTEVLKKLTPLD